jgi:mannose-6-phosphate isomerase
MINPQKLASNQFDHFYKGGNRIGALRHGPGGPMRPEEWIGSMTTRFGEKTMGLSTLDDGTFLRDSVIANPEQWLGAEHLNAFGASSELLMKLLDPDQRLPVHYHPNKKFAKEHLALNHGKTEAWIILESPDGAEVGLGFEKELKKSEVSKMVDARDSVGLLASLQKFQVKPGDTVFVPAGVPHAIGAGIFVLELQEPTDLSALLEWNDFAVDGVKDGHLGLGFDTVLDALRYTPIEKAEAEKLVFANRLFTNNDASVFTDVANPYFRADYLTGKASAIPAGFSIFLTLESSGSIKFDNAPAMEITKGDAILIPFNAGNWILNGASGVVCRPPLPKDAALAI